MKKIVYLNKGKVEICTPNYAAYPNKTVDEVVEIVKAKDVPADATDIKVITVSDLPASREHRDAWVLNLEKKVTVDPVKALAIDTDRAAKGFSYAALQAAKGL